MSDFPEAGSSEDLRAAYISNMIEQRGSEGHRMLTRARYLVESALSDADLVDAEHFAREGLHPLARSLDWAEDTPEEDVRHQALDAAGLWVRETFGCQYAQEGSSYFQRCPVALAHTRVGMSVGGVAVRRTCSLCGDDVSECPHRRDRAYLVPGGTDDLGWCRICLNKEACEHDPDQTYRTRVVGIIEEMALDEFSFVGKPANPEARLESVSVHFNGRRDRHGKAFEPGMPVSCDRCLSPCGGLVRPASLHT